MILFCLALLCFTETPFLSFSPQTQHRSDPTNGMAKGGYDYEEEIAPTFQKLAKSVIETAFTRWR